MNGTVWSKRCRHSIVWHTSTKTQVKERQPTFPIKRSSRGSGLCRNSKSHVNWHTRATRRYRLPKAVMSTLRVRILEVRLLRTLMVSCSNQPSSSKPSIHRYLTDKKSSLMKLLEWHQLSNTRAKILIVSCVPKHQLSTTFVMRWTRIRCVW